ncbi:MAG: leucine-rich repeat protein [Bacilli bacterium]
MFLENGVEVEYDDSLGYYYVKRYAGGPVDRIEIPSSVKGKPVRELADNAFRLALIKQIDLPCSLTKIGEHAFMDSGIRNLDIPEGMTCFPLSSVQGCRFLSSLVFPASLKSFAGLGKYDLSMVSNIVVSKYSPYFSSEGGLFVLDRKSDEIILNSGAIPDVLVLPEGISKIGPFTFEKLPHLKVVSFPSSLTDIGAYAFNGSENLQQVYFRNGISEIGDGAFSSTPSLSQVVLPKSLKKIGVNAFGSDLSYRRRPVSFFLEADVLSESLKAMLPSESLFLLYRDYPNPAEEGSFWHYVSGLATPFGEKKKNETEDSQGLIFQLHPMLKNASVISYRGKESHVVIPEKIDGFTVTAIEKRAFENSWVSVLGLPRTMTEIGDSAFAGSSLSRLELPEGFKDLGDKVFQNTVIKSLVIPSTLVDIDFEAGFGYPIDRISIAEYNPRFLVEDGYVLSKDRKHLLFAPRSLFGILYLPSGIEEIGDHAFEGRDGITEVVFPTSLRSIGKKAFSSCTSLNEILLNPGLKKIGESAFYNAPLCRLLIPRSVQKIDSFAFTLKKSAQDLKFDPIPLFLEGSSLQKGFKEHWVSEEGDYAILLYSEKPELESWRYVNGVPTPWHDLDY